MAIERSLQDLLTTNFALSPSGYTGSRGDTGPAGGYTGSAGAVGATGVGYTGSAGAGTTVPTIATIGYVGNNTATDVAGGETISLTGTGFATGCSVIINGSPVGAVTFISSTQVTFVAPALAAGTYILYLVNTNGSTAISVPGISYSGTPSFYTAAGSVGTVYEATAFNSNVAAVGDSPITYSIASGLLPTGAVLNANGVITGTSVLTGNTTTYTFGVNASDGQNQDVTRTYTITVNPDVVTWSSPANGATVNLTQNLSSSATLTAVSAAGSAIAYTANALPAGLAISGNVVTGTPTVTGNTTTLLTANATSTTRTATITVTWNVAVSGEPYFKYTTLLLSGNGSNNATNNTFVDGSTNNFTITRAGNATQGTFSPYGANWSNYFDGTGDYLTVPYSTTAFDWWTNDCTIEAWVYAPSWTSWSVATSTQPGLVGNYSEAENSNYWCFGPTANGTVKFYYWNGAQNYVTSTATVLVNQWNHIAFTKTSSGIKLWVNGVGNTATAIAGTPQSSVTYPLGIGKTTITTGITGWISNLRLVKGTAVYTTDFTPPAAPLTAITNTSLLTCQSNRFIDTSTTASAITRNGDVSVQRFSPFSPSASYSTSIIGGSAYFDGTGDYLTIADNSVLEIGSGDFTIEFWIYPMANASNTYYTWACKIPDNNYGTWYFPQYNGALKMFFDNDGATSWLINGVSSNYNAGTLTIMAWNHVAITRSGTSIRGFVNGIPGSTVTVTAGQSFADITSPISLGAQPAGSEPSIGYMCDFRFIRGTAVYTAAFTPPTAPLTAVTNTQLLCNFTNAGIIDNAMMNNLETVGDTKISTAQSKFGSSSIYFDGTGDCLLAPSSPNFDFGTGNFTIEMWINFANVTSTWQAIISRAYIITGGWRLYKNDANNQLRWYNSGTPLISTTGSTLSSNTWGHVAVVRNNGTTTIYIDGVNRGSAADSTNYNPGNYAVEIGKGVVTSEYPVTGYIDDLRITKGYARYNGNFTPPASALSTQ
jgi:hypothetical protein